jgi:zinc protease
LQTLFELVYLYATEPRGSDTFFSSYLTRLSSAIENRRRQPEAVFGDALQTILTQSHFRARPLTVELLDEMDLQRSLDVYRDRFADFSDATFVIVGAFDWGTLRRLTETYLGSLPGLQRQERWQDVGIDPPSGRVDEVVFRGLEPKSSSRLVFAGEMSWSRSEALALTVMGDVLQIRLRESLREELGGTYSVRVTTSARALPDQEYQVQVAFGSDPERADELMAAVLQEVQWLRDGGEQSYLEKVREIMRSDRQEQLRRNGFWLSALAAALERGEPLDDFLHLSDRLDALQLADVASAAQRYLTPENQVRVVLLPAAAAE